MLNQGIHSALENAALGLLKNTWLAEVKPSAYSWVFPNELANGQGISYIDEQAARGDFPTLISLAPALVYAVVFGLMRKVLHRFLFQVGV